VRRADGKEDRVTVAPAEHPALKLLRTRLGVEVDPMQFPLEDGVSVIRFSVREVREGSAADRIKVRPGDVVFSLAGVPLASADDIETVLKEISREQVVAIRVFRQSSRGWSFGDSELRLD